MWYNTHRNGGVAVIDEIKQTIKRVIEVNQELRVLRMIDKQVDKYNKLQYKLAAQGQILGDLIDLYNAIYDGDLCIIDLEEE